MNTSIKIIPFRWNIDKENELGSLIENVEDYLTDYFFKELISSSARILAFAGNSSLYFIGRSPESYFDFLYGIYDNEKKICDRINLFQFSGRFYSIEELTKEYFIQLENLKLYMAHIGLSPLQILEQKKTTAFIDVVYQGMTFKVLLQILKKWATDTHVDWDAVKNKLRIVGITERTKNSPNSMRWQQQPEWITLCGNTIVKNVSVAKDFWRFIANEQYKTTNSFYPDRWDNTEASDPGRSKNNLEGLKQALTIYKFGTQTECKINFRKQLVKQKELQYSWFKDYIKVLPS